MAPKLDSSLVPKLSKEQEDFVLKDINYSRQQLQADLKHIRSWLNDQQHLPPSRLSESDLFLETSLIASKGSLETVKRKLDSYYTMRGYSEIYDSRDPLDPIYNDFCSICDIAVAPGVGKNGMLLVLGRLNYTEADKFVHLSFAQCMIYRCEMFMRLGGYGTNIYITADCKGIPPSIIFKIKPAIVRDLMFLLEEVVSLRLYKASFINAPAYMEKIVNNLFKPFLSKKLRERVHISSTGDINDMLEYFSPNGLPSDYGGISTNPTLKELNERWMKNEQQNREWLMNELSERTDESKRIAIDNNTTKNSYFGLHGSLKKLEID